MLLPDDRCPAPNRRGEDQFCPLALSDWLGAAARAGIPHVAGRRAALFERDDLRNHEYHGPHQERLDRAFEEARAHQGRDTMMRWDCCASGKLKMALGEGARAADPAVRNCLAVDARLLTMLEEYPRVTLAAIVRPWRYDIVQWNGYPVEYRAFVESGRLLGISSYYPQRALRRADREIDAVRDMTAALAAAAEPPFQWGARDGEAMGIRKFGGELLGKEDPEAPDPEGVHFTADFVVTDRGVEFLEGGPPSFLGAHPCCFEGRDRIDGLALSKDEAPVRFRGAA